jgi:FKBP-type peptidyl-prolyl cis-trans isomerase
MTFSPKPSLRALLPISVCSAAWQSRSREIRRQNSSNASKQECQAQPAAALQSDSNQTSSIRKFTGAVPFTNRGNVVRCATDMNMIDREKFLKKNSPESKEFQEGVDGVRYRDVRMGVGRRVKAGRYVQLHYECKMLNGRVIEQSQQGMNSDFIKFIAGEFEDVPCLNHCVAGMREGGKREVIVPAHLVHPEHVKAYPSALAYIYEVQLYFVNVVKDSERGQLTQDELEDEKYASQPGQQLSLTSYVKSWIFGEVDPIVAATIEHNKETVTANSASAA